MLTQAWAVRTRELWLVMHAVTSLCLSALLFLIPLSPLLSCFIFCISSLSVLPHLLFPASSSSLYFAHLLLGFSLPKFKLPAWVGDYPIISYMNLATSMSLSCHHKESWVLICSPVVPPAAHLAGGRAEGGVCSSGLLLPSCLRVQVWGRDPDSDS